MMTNWSTQEATMPGTRASVKNEKQYEALKDKGMSKQRAARIANSPGSSSRGGQSSGSGTRRCYPEEGGSPAAQTSASPRVDVMAKSRSMPDS
jgi:hypothetical protein